MQALTSQNTLSDAAGVLAANQLVQGRIMPDVRNVAKFYATSATYEGLLRKYIEGYVAAGNTGVMFLAKASAFVAAEMLYGRLIGAPREGALVRALIINGGGLAASQAIRPFVSIGTKPAVAMAAAKNAK